MKTRSLVVLAALAAGLVVTVPSFGALLVDFKPFPISPGLKEVNWTGSQLTQGPGLVGNADGTLPPALQAVPGLLIQTPFNIPGVPGGVASADGSTSFYDVTMTLSGMAASGPANVNVIMPGLTVLTQPIGLGTFTLWSTDPDGAGPLGMTELLTGSVNDMVILGLAGATSGSVQSSTVTYTSGAIYNKLVQYGGTLTGSLSWSLLDINGPLGVVGVNLGSFSANETGQFSTPIIPEPATIGLMGLGMAAMLLVKRRK